MRFGHCFLNREEANGVILKKQTISNSVNQAQYIPFDMKLGGRGLQKDWSLKY